MAATLSGPNFKLGTACLLSQNIIHSPVARELCMDDEHLHINLEECQDQLKTWLIITANHAIFCLRGSLDENAGYFAAIMQQGN